MSAEETQFTESGYGGSAPPAFLPGGGGLPGFTPPEFVPEAVVVEDSKLKKALTWMAWSSVGISSLIFFTIAKLPEDRVKEIIQGNLAAALAPSGITLVAQKTSFSMWTGGSYTMKDVTLTFPPPEASSHIDQIEVSPTFSSLFMGKVGARISIENGDGKMFLALSARGKKVSLRYEAEKMDIGKIGLLRVAANISGSASISGKGNFSTNSDNLAETTGSTQLALDHIVINQQSIQGFSIPRIAVTDGQIDFDINQGRGVLKSLRLGKPTSTTDDIKANLSGDINLGKNLDTSTINVRANFSFSEILIKSFSLLEAILSGGKQPDGSFAYRLSGPLTAPNPIPIGPGGT